MGSGIDVWSADRNDVAWIIDRLPRLDRMWNGKGALFDESFATREIPRWVDERSVLIAETAGRRVGLVAGRLLPHVLNPSILVLYECLWWVDEGPARARAGLALMDAFVGLGKAAGAHWVTFSLMPASPAGLGALRRRGFRVVETVHLLET